MQTRPSDEEYAKLRWLLMRLQASEQYCRPFFDRAKRHYKLYRFSTAVDDKDWPYVNRVRSRDILAFVEDTTAILIQTLFATAPFFSVIPRASVNMDQLSTLGIDVGKLASQLEKLLDYQISHEDTDFLEEIIDYFKSGKIFGNSYIGVYPKFEADGSFFLPLLKNIDFWDILPIVGSNRLSKARGVFYRQFCTKEDLEKEAEQGTYDPVKVEELKSASGLDPTVEWHKNLMVECGMTAYVTSDDNIEVLHYFSGGHVITFGNRRVILRDSTIPDTQGQIDTPYPFSLPIVQYKDTPVPNEFFAMGIPEIIEVLQEDKNLIRSARRDNIDLCIQKIILGKEGADINYDLIKFYPGAIWPDLLGKIDFLDIPDVTQSSYAEEKQIQADMENALSLFGYARGMTPAHSEQPNTVMKLQQASLNRQDINVKLAEFTVLQEIARKILALDRRFMSLQTYEAIVGEPDAGFYKLPLEYVNRFYAVRPIGSSVSHIKEVRQAQIEFMLKTIMAMPPQIMQGNIQPFTVDYLEAARSALDAADVKNINKILIPMQPQQQSNPMMDMLSDPAMIQQIMQGEQQQGMERAKMAHQTNMEGAKMGHQLIMEKMKMAGRPKQSQGGNQ